MEDKIKSGVQQNFEKLERLYREDREAFGEAFQKMAAEFPQSEAVFFWKIRLEYDNSEKTFKKGIDWQEAGMVLAACFFAAVLIKIPLFFAAIDEELFYQRNATLIAFLGLTVYLILFQKMFQRGKLSIVAALFAIPAIAMNFLLPKKGTDHVSILLFLHLPLFLWFVYGSVYAGLKWKNLEKRLEYVRYNGDLLVMTALMLISGILLTVTTIALFSAIGWDIANFYAENVVVVGLVCAPIVATFVIKKYPLIGNKLAPIIAGIFSPLALITLLVYLGAILFAGKDPWQDREFLLIFNVMLLGVMALIFFSVSEKFVLVKNSFKFAVLSLLSFLAIIINGIALSAIIYRIGEYGTTPNRLAVAGSNLIIFIHLVILAVSFLEIMFKGKTAAILEKRIAAYLPVYLLWILFVLLGFPLIFGFGWK
jgi:hypothetical protein